MPPKLDQCAPLGAAGPCLTRLLHVLAPLETARENSDTQQPLDKNNRSCYAQPPAPHTHCWWDHYSKTSGLNDHGPLTFAIKRQRCLQEQHVPQKLMTQVPGTTPDNTFRQPGRSRVPAPTNKNDEPRPTDHFGINVHNVFVLCTNVS